MPGAASSIPLPIWDPGAVPTNEHPYDAKRKRQGAPDSPNKRLRICTSQAMKIHGAGVRMAGLAAFLRSWAVSTLLL